MRDPIQNTERLDDLIHRHCDNSLDDDSLRELEQLLASSDAAAKRYIEYVQVWTELLDWAEIAESRDEATLVERAEPSP